MTDGLKAIMSSYALRQVAGSCCRFAGMQSMRTACESFAMMPRPEPVLPAPLLWGCWDVACLCGPQDALRESSTFPKKFTKLGSSLKSSAQGLIGRCLLVQGRRRRGGSQQQPRLSLPPLLPMEALRSPQRPSWLLQQQRHGPLPCQFEYLSGNILPNRPPAASSWRSIPGSQILAVLVTAVLIGSALLNAICCQ